MSRKMEFVERAVEPGAKVAPLCREFGVSRQTGHKWIKRFREQGYEGLEEQSRRPQSSPLSLAEELVAGVLEARDAHPTWGPKKLHALLKRRHGEKTPSPSTVARILRRFGRVRAHRRRPALCLVESAPSVRAHKPNEVWTVDFKGWWRSLDGHRCEPLTVRDSYSRFILAVVLCEATVEAVRQVFERLFRRHGLPAAIQCDNGSPFVSVRSRGGLTRLSAWWVALCIRLVRGRRGCPQDNGAHERMHSDLAAEVEAAPARSVASQQRVLDRWRQEFNHVRPHDALAGKTPAEVYQPSERRGLQEKPAVYPASFVVRQVAKNGALTLEGDQYFLSTSLAGHDVGLEQMDELHWRVWFHRVDCGVLEVVPQGLENVAPQQRRAAEPVVARHDARHRLGPKRPPTGGRAQGRARHTATPAVTRRPKCQLPVNGVLNKVSAMS